MARMNWAAAKRNRWNEERAVPRSGSDRISRRELSKLIRDVEPVANPSNPRGIVTWSYYGPDHGPNYPYENQVKRGERA